MKGKIDYKAKRNIAIVVIVLVLFIIASVSTYVYLRGNSETKASEINSMTENQNASQEQVGNSEDVQNNEQTTDEETIVGENSEEQQVTNSNSEEVTEVADANRVDTTDDNTILTTQDNNAQTHTIITTETVEETNTLVGFTTEDVNLGLSELTGKLPPLLTLNGDAEMVLEMGVDTYKELGATVSIDGNQIITDLKPVLIYYSVNDEFKGEVDEVDTIKAGTYKIVYKYTDSEGNIAVDANRADHDYVMRIVTVKDTVVPEIIVKDGYVGSLDKNVFSSVSFKLHDNCGVVAYKINDGEWKEVTVNTWSDANFDNIKDKLVYGTNTITVKDVAGNEATYTFVYDNVAPTITVKDRKLR